MGLIVKIRHTQCKEKHLSINRVVSKKVVRNKMSGASQNKLVKTEIAADSELSACPSLSSYMIHAQCTLYTDITHTKSN